MKSSKLVLYSRSSLIVLLFIVLFSLFGVTDLSAYYYGQNKVNSTYTGWSQIATMHFDIYFPEGCDEFGKLAALMAEETYYYIKQDFQFPAMTRIPVIFYNSQMEFQTTNIIYPLLSEGVGGFTESLKNRVAVPFDGNYAKLESVLTHELTHAYINALDSGTPGSFFYLRNYSFPFWFSEGLPEYEAVGGTDINNNAFIMDLAINDRLRPLDESSGYSSYRMGEAFLVFLNKRYGRDKVMDYFFTLRALSDPSKAAKKVFGMNFKDLETRWMNQLKRDNFPYVSSHTIPNEYSEIKTNHTEESSYFNLDPRFSPDGQKYVYYSNRGGRYSIWTGGLFESSKNRKLIVGETSGAMEEFHYLRSTFAWFSDNNRFAFVAKTSTGDKIYVADFDKAKIITKYTLPDIKTIYEMDISPDGKSCVISGQKGIQSDIFLYDFTTQSLKNLTNDRYYDYQPRFAHNGKSIAFASERTRIEDSFRKGFFSNLRSNLYTLELTNNTLSQVTFNNFNCYHPVWDSSGTKLLYISERDSVPNIEMLDIPAAQRTTVTKTLSGVYSFDLNNNDSYLVYSGYYNSGWDIFLKTSPLSELKYTPCTSTRIIEPTDSLFSKIDFSRLDYYGKRHFNRPITDGGPRMYNKGSTVIDFHPNRDSLFVKHDYSWDNKPDSISVIPKLRSYKVKYSLDRLWGGFAYTASVGTIGSLEMGLSDVMGNNAIGINLGVSGKIKDSNIILTYLYLPYRIDYGIGVYNVLDEVYYTTPTINEYDLVRQRQTGLYFLLRYPMSKFFRLDFENQLYNWEQHVDLLKEDYDPLTNIWTDTWDKDYKPVTTDLIYAPALTFVQDNALYGPTGPLMGLRTFLTLRKSFALHGNDFHTIYTDLRSYSLINKRYAIAMRLVGGLSDGKQPQTFNLNGYYGVRGYDGEAEGNRMTMATAEVRFPFLDYFAMAFPLPLTITSIRGSVFTDIGGVWNDSYFRGMENERLHDLKMGYGFGPRLNIGFAVLKFDVAWRTDLVNNSRPAYYFSLTEDF